MRAGLCVCECVRVHSRVYVRGCVCARIHIQLIQARARASMHHHTHKQQNVHLTRARMHASEHLQHPNMNTCVRVRLRLRVCSFPVLWRTRACRVEAPTWRHVRSWWSSVRLRRADAARRPVALSPRARHGSPPRPPLCACPVYAACLVGVASITSGTRASLAWHDPISSEPVQVLLNDGAADWISW